MRKNMNTERITGYIYSFGEANGKRVLEKKVTGPNSKNPGTEYIAGVINVAVDEQGLNVIPVTFTYVTPTYSSGKKNNNFDVLAKIIEEGKTWVSDGKDVATKVQIDASLGLNDFYIEDATRGEVLVSSKVNEGSFISIISVLPEADERNTFKVDMVITNITHIEADEEKKIDADYVNVRGAVFNFRNELLPVEFVVRNPQGMKYFESLEASSAEPYYTKVWGKINCATIVNQTVEESAFGEAAVRTFEKKVREWVITGAAKEAYDFGEDEVMTEDELLKAMQDRQVKLADIKKRNDDWKNEQSTPAASAPKAAAAPKAKNGGFNF